MSASSPPSDDLAEAACSVRLPGDVDLHARPARDVVGVAARFTARIVLSVQDRQAEATSILQVLGLGARRGTAVTVQARGADAQAAAAAVAAALVALR